MILKINTSSPYVLFLQAFLGLKPDGSFGPKTEEAVKNYQTKNSLTPDGVVGPKTWEVIASQKIKAIEDDYKEISKEIGLTDHNLLKAFKEVETSGKTWLSSGLPQILFEGHIFWKELKNLGKNPTVLTKGNEDILYPSWTKKFYKGGESEYSRLEKAWKISPTAALMSASAGMFQIMGNNWKISGCSSVQDYWAKCFMSEKEQIRCVGMFMKSTGIIGKLNKHDWAGAAKSYNGPGYAQNSYDKKLEAAWKKMKG